MDLLDDPFAEPQVAKVAPVAGRFQPKAKPRPKKPTPAAAKPTTKAPPAASVPKDLFSSQPAENVLAEKESAAAKTADITSSEGSEKPLENGDLSAKEKEVAGSSVAERSETDVSGPSHGTDLNAGSSMGSKLLDDPFAEPKVAKVAPVAGRFQPKAKPRPKKPPPASAKPTTKAPPAASVPKDSVSSQPAENVLAEKDSAAAKTADTTSTGGSEKPLENGDLSAKEKEVAGSSVAERSETAVSCPSQGTDLNAGSSMGSKVPPGVTDLSATTVDRPTETLNIDASSVQGEKELHCSNVSFGSVSPLRPCNSQAAIDKSVDKTLQESESCEESFFGGDGDFQIDVEKLGVGDFSCLDTMDMMSEGASVSEKRAAKLMPKPKAQGDRQKYPAEAVSHPPHSPMVPSEDQHMSINGSIHAEEPVTFSDVLHMTLDGNISADPSGYQPDTVISEDAESLMPENLPKQSGENQGKRKSNVAVDSSVKSVDEELLFGFQGNENEYGPLDGINDDFYENNNSYDRAPDESVLNRLENNDGDNLGEDTSKKKKPRKSKKVVTETDKPTRKRRKAVQKPEDSIEKPPKKFPRSTRRKRTVDKALLEAPEDELDLQRVPIKDLIVLAEYKERQAKKEAAAVLPPQTSERIDNVSEDAPYDDNETYGFDQDGDASDNPSTSEVQIDTGYFNYQSHMTKEPRARWTKTDTELFYKGISQFGSDLSMVQQLFPGRTRHQIKLKYKNEERQNPMRLHDALTSRTQDLSHFKLVIQRLEEQAARDKEDSVSPSGEDEELEEALNTHDDATESKNKEEGRAADQEPDRPEVESPKSYYSEQEDFDWSDYKCDF